MADSKCMPRIPYERWAVDAGIEGGEKDWANWKYFRVWAQRLLDECIPTGGEFTASYEDTLSVGFSSLTTTRYYPPGSWSVNELILSSQGTDSGDWTFNLRVNGVTAASVTLPAGENVEFATVSVSGSRGDYLEFAAGTPGDGASSLTDITVQAVGHGVSAGLNFHFIGGG